MDARTVIDRMRGVSISIGDSITNRLRNNRMAPSSKEAKKLREELTHLEYAIKFVEEIAGHDQEPQAVTRHIADLGIEEHPLDMGMGIRFLLDDRRIVEVKFTDDSRIEIRALDGHLQVSPVCANMIYVDVARR